MNKNLSIRNHNFQITCLVIAGLCVGLTSQGFSQAEEKAEKTEILSDTSQTKSEKTNEKKKLRISFDAFKINDEVKLQTTAKFKVEGKFQNIAGVEVSFYKGDVAETANFLGKDTSNVHGEAFWVVPAAAVTDTASVKTYLASVQNDVEYEDAEETVSVNSSVMELNLEEADSVRMVKIFLGAPDATGQIVPIAGAPCQLYVKRLFGLLPIGDAETTDEEGRIVAEFPKDIKGDEAGNIMIVAQVAEHEIVGNVEANKTILWGVPTKVDDFYKKRELWSARANAPIPLVIIVNFVLLGVWGSIAFIFLEIFRINKIGRTKTE